MVGEISAMTVGKAVAVGAVLLSAGESISKMMAGPDLISSGGSNSASSIAAEVRLTQVMPLWMTLGSIPASRRS